MSAARRLAVKATALLLPLVRSILPLRVRRIIGGSRPARWLSDIGLARRIAAVSDLSIGEVRARLMQPGPVTSIAVTPLGGRKVSLRPGSADVYAIEDAFVGRYHLPPDDIKQPELIVDLGSNIGLTMAHFAHLFPRAQLVGIELDDENHALCERNIAPWGDRCSVVRAAVWKSDGEVAYSGSSGHELAYRVGREGDEPKATVAAVSIDSLLARFAPGQIVDYMKMDIEGAEEVVLQDPGPWTQRVRCLKAEIHPPYMTVQSAREALERCGFEVTVDGRHDKAIVARKSIAP